MFLFCLAAVLGGLAWWVSRPRAADPVYKGKALSYWMKGYVTAYRGEDGKGRAGADEAVRSVGTNAIPLLLQMLRAKDIPGQARICWELRNQKTFKFYPLSAEDLHAEAQYAFAALGSKGKSAVPQLMQICEENKSSRLTAVLCLTHIGPDADEAVPLLVEVAGDTNFIPRLLALGALGAIHTRPEMVVPLLSNLLTNSSTPSELHAAWALQKYGPSAKSAVPALMQAVHGPNALVRGAAKDALTVVEPGWSVKEEQSAK